MGESVEGSRHESVCSDVTPPLALARCVSSLDNDVERIAATPSFALIFPPAVLSLVLAVSSVSLVVCCLFGSGPPLGPR